VIGMKAEIDGAHFLEAAQQKARGGEQNQGNSELCDHKSRAQTCMSAARGTSAAAFLQGIVYACA